MALTPLLPTSPDGDEFDVVALRLNPPSGEARIETGRKLVRRALDQRDAEAARLTAEWMDADPALDAELWAKLERALTVQPDAVYTFVRAVVANTANTNSSIAPATGSAEPADNAVNRAALWRERLKVAALASLQVAITDGDSETVLNWLRLIAREPAAYGLGEVLNAGIAAAQKRAVDDPEMARALVLLAARRAPVMLDDLLGDDSLRSQLPDALCEALHYGVGDSEALLENFGAEVFLATLIRATGLKKPDLFSAAAVERVWAMANGENGNAAAADRLIKLWSGGDTLDWMPTDAVTALLTVALLDKRDDLFYALIARIAGREDFAPILALGIARSGRGAADALALIAQIIAAGSLDQQGAADVYVMLLEAWSWDAASFPVIEQLARILQQHPEVQITSDALWQILDVAAELKEDFASRTAIRRLTAGFEALEDEIVLAEEVTRLFTVVNWHGAARAGLLTWWREYTHEASVARLQRLDRALPEKGSDGRRSDDLKAILQTTLAFRRMLGKRTLEQFAEDIATTYSVLQALTESFDPNLKRTLQFHSPTFRSELENYADAVPPHQRKILANNLKELAQLVTSMAEHRSKATIVRRAEDIDRMLMTGDQDPHGSIDALKWMAGFLGGSQQDSDEE